MSANLMCPRAAGTLLAGALFVSAPLFAELQDRGGGLIYDDVLDVTWLQDTNYAKTSGLDDDGRFNWDDAMAYAADLSYWDSVREVWWENWRLPHALPVNGVAYDDSFSFDGSTDNAYNIISPHSELSYMFYVNLGIQGYADPEGNWPVPSFGFTPSKAGPFDRMLGASVFPYWTSTEYPPFDGMAYVMVYKTGSQHGAVKKSALLVWPVMDGDVGLVPAPKPELGVVSPQPGDLLQGIVMLKAERLNGNVRSVSFLANGALACVASEPQFECLWNTATRANGVYSLQARGVGYDGAVTTLPILNVTITN